MLMKDDEEEELENQDIREARKEKRIQEELQQHGTSPSGENMYAYHGAWKKNSQLEGVRIIHSPRRNSRQELVGG